MRALPAAIACTCLTLAAGGCGSGGRASVRSSSPSPRTQIPSKAPIAGGTLTVLGSEPDSLDPGISYSQEAYSLIYATQRPLFSYKPGSLSPVPDLALGPARISRDGKLVTVRIRTGVHFSPP